MAVTDWLNITVQIAVLVAALSAGYWGLRRWVQRAAVDARKAAGQLETSNGTTVAGYVEQSAGHLAEIRAAIGTLTARADSNRELATSALALARHASERLDAHLTGHARGGDQP